MAANLNTSAKSGKRRTKRTPQQELEILQQSIANCMTAGIDLRMKILYDSGKKTLAVIFGTDVEYQDGNLTWIE